MRHVTSVTLSTLPLALLCFLLAAGCGGGGSGAAGAPPTMVVQSLPDNTGRAQTISVTLRPDTLTIFVGKSETFTPTVTGSDNKAVTWSIQEGDIGGSITPNGRYTAPAKPGTFHVVARSKANPDKKAVATVTVKAEQSVISLSINPLTLTLFTGKSETFSATVTGTDNKGVIWSVQEGVAGGSITEGGRYTAPATPGTYHVIATSKANPDKKAVATVTVKSVK